MKKLILVFAVAFGVLAANAQGTAAKQESKPAVTKLESKSTARTVSKVTPVKAEAKPASESKVEKTSGNAEAKTANAQVKTETKVVRTETKATAKTEKKPADARTKTGDKVNHDKKGPNGETVYTGPKGGFYYLDKKENKVYIK